MKFQQQSSPTIKYATTELKTRVVSVTGKVLNTPSKIPYSRAASSAVGDIRQIVEVASSDGTMSELGEGTASEVTGIAARRTLKVTGKGAAAAGKKTGRLALKGGVRAGRYAGRQTGAMLMRNQHVRRAVASARRNASLVRGSVRGAARGLSRAIKMSKPVRAVNALKSTKLVRGVGRAFHAAGRALAAVAKLVSIIASASVVIIKVVVILVAVLTVIAIISSILSIFGIKLEEDEKQTARTTAASVPAQYQSYVNKAGSICPEITAPLIAAQIEQESGWNPKAQSDAGAQGISQFMPDTWKTEGGDYDSDGVADVWNPADAIVSQGHFMCNIVKQLRPYVDNGSIKASIQDAALAGYNAGPQAVIDHGGVPSGGDYDETKNYVAKINSLKKKYDSGQTPNASSPDVQAALEWAKGIANDDTNQYVWGGSGPTGWDCSGLTQAFLARLGVSVEHSAQAQSSDSKGIEIPQDQIAPGDLLYWNHGNGSWHAAIALGGGQMVSADSEEAGINVEPIFGNVYNVRRFV